MKIPEVVKAGELKGHAGPVYALCAGSRPETIFSGSSDGFVAEWNLENFTAEKFSVKIGNPVYSLCFIAEYNLLIAGTGSGAFHVIDLTQKKELRMIVQHREAVFDLLYNPLRKHLYTVSGDGTFCAWELPSFRHLFQFPLCSEKIRNLSLSFSGEHLAIACGDRMVRVFETDFYNLREEWLAHEMGANSVCYLRNDDLISGGKDAFLHWWRHPEQKPFRSVAAHNYAVYSLASDPEFRYFASASRDKTIKLWDADSGAFLLRIDRKNFGGHKNSVNRIFWSDYNNYLISTGDDRSIMVWKIS